MAAFHSAVETIFALWILFRLMYCLGFWCERLFDFASRNPEKQVGRQRTTQDTPRGVECLTMLVGP